MCAVGEKTFKLFRLSEGQLKQFAVNKMNQLNYFSHVWVSEDQVLLGSDSGRLQLFEVGDLRSEFEVGASEVVSARPSHISSRDLSRKSM